MGTKPEFLFAKDEMLVALAIWIAYEPMIFRKGQIGPFFIFLGPSLIPTRDSRNGAVWWKHCYRVAAVEKSYRQDFGI